MCALTLRLAVAVSGGADSSALLLHAARTFPQSAILALAVDHQTRVASAAECAQAARLAARLGIGFQALTVSPKGYGHAHWRDARYTALIEYCRAAGIPTLWLGQHKDDAIETAATRLLADGPLEGMAGIAASRDEAGIRIERPLLDQSAHAIRRRLMSAGIGWVEDPSNRNLTYKRAAIRLALVEPSESHAAAAARIRRIAAWRSARDQAISAAWRLVARPSPLGAVAFAPAGLAALPVGLQGRLLRHAALWVTGDPQRLRQADCLGAAASGPPARLGGALLVADGPDWWVCRDADAIGRPQPLAADLVWDQRCRLALATAAPVGKWSVEALHSRRIGAIARWAPSPVLAALPAVLDKSGIVAIPHLGLWRGRHGPFWAANLHCSWTAPPEPQIFQLAP